MLSIGVCTRWKRSMFRFIRLAPTVSRKINEERRMVYELFKKEVIGRCEGLAYTTTLPKTALKSDEILDLIKTHVSCGT